MDRPRFALDEYIRHPDARPLPEPPERWYRSLCDGIRHNGLRLPIEGTARHPVGAQRLVSSEGVPRPSGAGLQYRAAFRGG
jgi:hypothetical protein